MDIDLILNQLKLITLSKSLSREKVLHTLELILLWLSNPQNNTNENCQKIDSFVAYEIIPQKEYEAIPEDIKVILFDIGASLSDTHTSPEVAVNFESTPSQLLERVKKLLEDVHE